MWFLAGLSNVVCCSGVSFNRATGGRSATGRHLPASLAPNSAGAPCTPASASACSTARVPAARSSSARVIRPPSTSTRPTPGSACTVAASTASVDVDLQRLRRRQQSMQFGERAAGDDAAVVDDDDAVGQPFGLFHVVRRVDQRLAGAGERFQAVEDRVAALRVDAGGRFVEQQHVGVVHQRTGDVEPSLHPAAEGRRLVACPVRQARPSPAPRQRDVSASPGPGRRATRTVRCWPAPAVRRTTPDPAARGRFGACTPTRPAPASIRRRRRCRRRPASARRSSRRSSTCRRRWDRADPALRRHGPSATHRRLQRERHRTCAAPAPAASHPSSAFWNPGWRDASAVSDRLRQPEPGAGAGAGAGGGSCAG